MYINRGVRSVRVPNPLRAIKTTRANYLIEAPNRGESSGNRRLPLLAATIEVLKNRRHSSVYSAPPSLLKDRLLLHGRFFENNVAACALDAPEKDNIP